MIGYHTLGTGGHALNPRLFRLILFIFILFGAPYAALILNRAMGPWSAVGIERDGSRTSMQFDPDMALPTFELIFPGAKNCR